MQPPFLYNYLVYILYNFVKKVNRKVKIFYKKADCDTGKQSSTGNGCTLGHGGETGGDRQQIAPEPPRRSWHDRTRETG
jgi:hypothetical protein